MGALIWVALDLRRLAITGATPARIPTIAIWTLCVLALQLMFGAYVAGLDAGYAFSSWPRMGDEWFPSDTQMLSPFTANFVDNPIVVQFVHRWLAFVVAGLVLALAWQASMRGFNGSAAAVGVAVVLQIWLGIATLVSGVELPIAVSHQAMAALLLAAVVVAAKDVPQSYQALLSAVVEAGGRVITSELNEQDRRNVTGTVAIEFLRAGKRTSTVRHQHSAANGGTPARLEKPGSVQYRDLLRRERAGA